MNEYLYDKEFLYKLDRQHNREIYARIIALSWEETPLETIEGKVTGGSINIDGASAVRRSCSLSLVSQEVNINTFYWGLKSKFQLYIGIKNTVDSKYDDIIWFKQGIYIINSFNTSQSVNSFTVSISGKDKMCLLNGELGGQITASTDFGVITDYSTNPITYTPILLKDIIRNVLYTYAKEPYQNIRIFDLDEYGLELLEYKGDNPLYFIKNGNLVENMTTNGSMRIDGKPLIEHAHGHSSFTYNGISGCTCQEVNQYEAAGYRITDLVYAGDLIANVGENITSILDKIKNMLGEFEYFYDVDGYFIFQRKKIHINIPWNQETEDSEGQVYIDPTATRHEYYFEDSVLISSFQNTPNLSQVRNDFSIWGTRKSITGSDLPVHLRYAIDKKPIQYKRIWDKNRGFIENGEIYTASNSLDWRELIYQMALDYFGNDFEGNWTKDNFKTLLQKHNPWCKNGNTGYEQYYTDLQGFWRQLYDPTKKPGKNDDGTIEYNAHGWNILVDKNPAMLNFWFDFLDADGSALAQYSVPAIGQRNKAVNDNQIKAIKYKEVPEVVYNNKDNSTGMTSINVNSALIGAFSISSQGKSAMDVLNDYLYQHSCITETISINSLPIYYLQPNVRIKVLDKNSGINGEYIVSKITLPLTYNGNMSISATKVIDKII